MCSTRELTSLASNIRLKSIGVVSICDTCWIRGLGSGFGLHPVLGIKREIYYRQAIAAKMIGIIQEKGGDQAR